MPPIKGLVAHYGGAELRIQLRTHDIFGALRCHTAHFVRLLIGFHLQVANLGLRRDLGQQVQQTIDVIDIDRG